MSGVGDDALERLLLARRVEAFFYHEAALLDAWQLEAWLELLADDVHYFAPMQRNVPFGEGERRETRPGRDIAWFDEGRRTLEQRVRQVLTGVHWAEEPLSRTTRMVGNVLVGETQADGGLPVTSRIVVYRNRGEDEVELLAGRREDLLMPHGDTFRIRRRKVVLDQNVLLAKNLTLFF